MTHFLRDLTPVPSVSPKRDKIMRTFCPPDELPGLMSPFHFVRKMATLRRITAESADRVPTEALLKIYKRSCSKIGFLHYLRTSRIYPKSRGKDPFFGFATGGVKPPRSAGVVPCLSPDFSMGFHERERALNPNSHPADSGRQSFLEARP